MNVRFAKTEDVPGIIALLKQVGQVHHDGRPDIFRAGAQKYGPSQVLAMLDKPGTVILVAAEEEAVLGYCFCFVKTYEKDPVITDHTELYIDDLCIEETCRGQRIGKQLFDAACRYARQRGCHNVTLNVWSCNPGAMEFYRAMGMQPQKIGMELML